MRATALQAIDDGAAAGAAFMDTAIREILADSGWLAAEVHRRRPALALSLTTLGGLREGDAVNLEPALRLSDRLGGHLVSGHVDGLGTIVAIESDARSQRWRIAAPQALARYIAAKGSICVDGVSLTVNAIDGNEFEVNLVPHTVAHTTFHDRNAGDRVNLEIDMLARYIERLTQTGLHPDPSARAGEGRVGGETQVGGGE